MRENNKHENFIEPRSFDGELRHISAQIRSIGWLVSNQPDHAPLPTDLGEVLWGLGTLIEGLGEEIREISVALEEVELRQRSRNFVRPSSD